MRTNRTKARLLEKHVVIGADISIPSPELVELSAAVGFDFVTIDAEHQAMSEDQTMQMIRAAEAFDITPIVRLARDPNIILHFLDGGAQGIHVPQCSSADDARKLVECARFYPQGKRTFYALGRSANYGVGIADRHWSEAANRELLLVGMIEDVGALDHVNEIVAVPHLDAIHVGPKDLWQSMGMPDDPSIVDDVVRKIGRAATAAGKDVSLTLRITDDVLERIAGHVSRGVRMLTLSPLDFVRRDAHAFIRSVRSGVGRP